MMNFTLLLFIMIAVVYLYANNVVPLPL